MQILTGFLFAVYTIQINFQWNLTLHLFIYLTNLQLQFPFLIFTSKIVRA